MNAPIASQPFPRRWNWFQFEPDFRRRSPWGRLGICSITAVVYWGLGHFAFQLLSVPGPQALALFPSAGWAAAMVLLFGEDALLGVALGSGAIAAGFRVSWLIVLWTAIRSSLEAGLIVYLIRQQRVDRRLHTLRDVLGFVVFAAPLPILLNALMSTFAERWTLGIRMFSQPWQSVWTIFVADMLSVMMITPLILLIGQKMLTWRRATIGNRWRYRRRGWLEVLLWSGFTLVALTYQPTSLAARLLIRPFPLISLAWAAARSGVFNTVLVAFIVNSTEIRKILAVGGAYVWETNNVDSRMELLMLQGFMVVNMVMGLCLAAVTEERQQLLESVLQEQRFDRVLVDLSHRLAGSFDPQTVMETVVQEIRQVLVVDRAYISQVQLDGSTQVIVESCGSQWRSCLGYQFTPPVAEAITQWYRGQGVEVTTNVEQARRQLHPITFQLCEAFQVQARVAIPVLVDGAAYAVLAVHECVGPRDWTSQEITFLEQIASPLGTALHQGILYQRERNLVVELDRKVQARTQELQRSLVAQELLNEGQSRLLNAVSHDLRTPVVGSLLVLQQLTKHPERCDGHVLDRLQASSERQLQLIQALLEDYRAEDATIRFNFQTLDYRDLVQQTLQTLAPILEQRQAIVRLHIPADLPPIAADPIHIQRVLDNLVTNALKHNQPGLVLTFDAVVVAQGDQPYLRCIVADDGVGIPLPVAQQLFSRPYLRSTHDASRSGLGLGLYLCNQIIRAHGGVLTVEPIEGEGADFSFTLPIAKPTPESSTVGCG
jgi:signal transduction histidine kinase